MAQGYYSVHGLAAAGCGSACSTRNISEWFAKADPSSLSLRRTQECHRVCGIHLDISIFRIPSIFERHMCEQNHVHLLLSTTMQGLLGSLIFAITISYIDEPVHQEHFLYQGNFFACKLAAWLVVAGASATVSHIFTLLENKCIIYLQSNPRTHLQTALKLNTYTTLTHHLLPPETIIPSPFSNHSSLSPFDTVITFRIYSGFMFPQRQHSATTPYSIVEILACSSYLHATS